MAKKAAYGKALTKTETIKQLAEKSDLDKKQVQTLLDALGDLIAEQLAKSGPGVINIPGMMKVKVVDKPAKAAYKGLDRFTGEERMFKAKPASRTVKVTPLKALKDKVA